MQEMTINNTDIADFNARLLSYSVGGTTITRTMGNSFNANFPKLFHTDFGQRKITITVVFKPEIGKRGIISKLHNLAMNKSEFDSVICSGIVDIWLPDGFYYNCILNSVGDEIVDGESLEVTYSLSGVRHDSLCTQKGLEPYCNSTVNTDCRITIKIGSDWNDEDDFHFIINKTTSDYNSIKIQNVKKGDTILIDGIRACSHKKSIKNHSQHDNRKKN